MNLPEQMREAIARAIIGKKDMRGSLLFLSAREFLLAREDMEDTVWARARERYAREDFELKLTVYSEEIKSL